MSESLDRLPDLLTREDVAGILKVHPKTVSRLAIPSIALGKGRRARRRWRMADVERWMEEHAA